MKLREHPNIKKWPLEPGGSYGPDSTFTVNAEQLVIKKIEMYSGQGSIPCGIKFHFETANSAIMFLDGGELKVLRTNLFETVNRHIGHIGRTQEYIGNLEIGESGEELG